MMTNQSLPLSHPPDHPLRSGIDYLTRALDQFETLLSIGLAVTVLSLVLDAIHADGFGTAAVPVYGVAWAPGFGSVLAAIATASIVVLVLIGLFFALSALIAWRRGVWSLRRAAAETPGPDGTALVASLRDDRSTFISVLLVVGVTITVGVILGITQVALTAVGASLIPAAIASLVIGLTAGGAVVLVYFYGTRHLLEALEAAAPRRFSTALGEARTIILVGAVLGWVGAISSVAWPAQAVSVAGLLLILVGFRRFKMAYHTTVGRSIPGAPGLPIPPSPV